MTEAMHDAADEAVGHRLRKIRKDRRLSLAAVEELSNGEFKNSILGAYERGARELSVSRLQRLAALYHVSVEEILATVPPSAVEERRAPAERTDDGSPDASPLTIDMARLALLPTERWQPLAHYLGRIQFLRGCTESPVLTVRGHDVEAIAMVYGIDRDVLVDRLQWAGLCPDARRESDEEGAVAESG